MIWRVYATGGHYETRVDTCGRHCKKGMFCACQRALQKESSCIRGYYNIMRVEHYVGVIM